MSAGVTALAVGALLAVAAVAFVLYPLFFSVAEPTRPAPRAGKVADDSAILALREIEFDRATGKLSESDYTELKKTYSEMALRELRASSSHPERSEESAPAPLDAIEAKVREFRLAHRTCANCGVRPEPDAIYCSTCGAFLDRTCPQCKTPIGESGAAFCSTCGATLVETRAGALT